MTWERTSTPRGTLRDPPAAARAVRRCSPAKPVRPANGKERTVHGMFGQEARQCVRNLSAWSNYQEAPMTRQLSTRFQPRLEALEERCTPTSIAQVFAPHACSD